MALARDCEPYQDTLEPALVQILIMWTNAWYSFEDALNYHHGLRHDHTDIHWLRALNDSQASRMLDLLGSLVDRADYGWGHFGGNLRNFHFSKSPRVVSRASDLTDGPFARNRYNIAIQCTGDRIVGLHDNDWDRDYDRQELNDCFADDVPVGKHSAMTSRSTNGPSIIQICPKLLNAWHNVKIITFLENLRSKDPNWGDLWPNLIYTPFRRLLMQAMAATRNAGDYRDIQPEANSPWGVLVGTQRASRLKNNVDTYAKFILGVNAIIIVPPHKFMVPDNEVS